MKSGYLDPFMMRILSENVTKPAKDLGWQSDLASRARRSKRKSATAIRPPFFLPPLFAIHHFLMSQFERVSCSI